VTSSSSSAKRIFSRLAGHGRIFEAETVRQAAKNVRPKRDDMNERRWLKRITLFKDIFAAVENHEIVVNKRYISEIKVAYQVYIHASTSRAGNGVLSNL